MIDFSEFKILDDKTLKKLNEAIEEVLKEKHETKLDYDLIERLVSLVLSESHFIENLMIPSVPQFTQEQLVGYAIKFYQSFGGEIYKKALNTVLQLYPNIKLNIYDRKNPKILNRKNEFGHFEYTPAGQCCSTYGNVTLTVPLKKDYEEKNSSNRYSIDSLYTLVHEIAHSLDVDYEGERETILGKSLDDTRDYFCECTSIAFEYLLSQFLLDYSDIPKDAIQEHSILINNSTRRDAITVYAKLILAKEKEKSGKIDYRFVEKSMKEHHLFKCDIRDAAYSVIDSHFPAFYQARYAIGRLFAPTIVKAYNNKGPEAIERYLNEIKKGNVKNAASVLDIDIKSDGIAKLIKNMLDYESYISSKEFER